MSKEIKPQVGDIKIAQGCYGYRVFNFIGGLTGWQDTIGYITKDKGYALSFVKDMVLYHEDDSYQYYRTAVSAPVPTREKIPVKTREKKPIQVGEHKRGSYTRTIATKSITFKCAHCSETVTQERYPSPKPMYCTDTCKKEVEKEQTRLRVQRLRASRKSANHVG